MFILLNVSMWFNRLIRIFFFWIDKIIYNFIPMIYDLLISIARTSVLTQGDISAMAGRIYKLLAVFMIFKVTFSLIMYVVNPDDFSEKTKGVGKLTSNIILTLALLILTPYFFRIAYELQAIILEDNSLATLVFGTGAKKEFLTTAGDDMAYITISPFLTPNLGITALHDCSDLFDENGNVSIECTGIDYEDLQPTLNENSMYGLVNDNFDEDSLKTYVAGLQNKSFPLVFRLGIITATNEANDTFIMDYKFIISTVVGVVVLLLLVTFCMDVALRSIKLAFLQLIAPIPIISFVDPKSGKDGLFKKWYQMCFKTFVSLFVRLLALYFAVYIISMVADRKLVDVIDGSYVSNGLVKILIIIGALMFAKQLPKILEGLGIKLDGDGKFILNPIKKLSEEAVGGKQIVSAGGALAAGGAAFGTNLIASHFNPFSALAGGMSATSRGLINARKGEGFGKNFSNSYGSAMQARVNRKERHDLGIGYGEYLVNRAEQKLNMETPGQRLSRVNQNYRDFSSAMKASKSEAESLIEKKSDKLNNKYEYKIKGGGTSTKTMSISQALAQAQIEENRGNAEGAAAIRAAVAKNKSDWAKVIQARARDGSLNTDYSKDGATYNGTTFEAGDEVAIRANMEAAEQVLRTSPETRELYRRTTNKTYRDGAATVSDLADTGKAAGNEATRTSTEEKVRTTLDKQGAKKNG